MQASDRRINTIFLTQTTWRDSLTQLSEDMQGNATQCWRRFLSRKRQQSREEATGIRRIRQIEGDPSIISIRDASITAIARISHGFSGVGAYCMPTVASVVGIA